MVNSDTMKILAKTAYLLAKAMKPHAFLDAAYFKRIRGLLQAEYNGIAANAPHALDRCLIASNGDCARLMRYEAATWSHGQVDLARCRVWYQEMGTLGIGGILVPEVVEKLPSLDTSESTRRIAAMRQQLDSHVVGEPLVVFTAPGIHPKAQ